MHGNVFRNIGLGGVILLSTTQGTPPCADLASRGTIAQFTSTGDTFTNFSTSYPGKYFAISANGPKILRANISQITADGQTNGRAALNLGSVARATSANITEINLAGTLTAAALTRLLLSLHF